MSAQIIENDNGTIKAFILFSGMNIDEVQIEAEMIDHNQCEITRVFVEITKEYGEQNLDMGRLGKEIRQWEQEIVDAVAQGNDHEK